jgi:Transglycosylase SLT domain
MEVILPKNFAFASLHRSFASFAAQGVKGATGVSFPQGKATLFFPSGVAGPAFLLSANYWVLKEYNNSDSYALSLALLAERIDGKPGLQGHWPEGEVFSAGHKRQRFNACSKGSGSITGSSTAASARPRAMRSTIFKSMPEFFRPTGLRGRTSCAG